MRKKLWTLFFISSLTLGSGTGQAAPSPDESNISAENTVQTVQSSEAPAETGKEELTGSSHNAGIPDQPSAENSAEQTQKDADEGRSIQKDAENSDIPSSLEELNKALQQNKAKKIDIDLKDKKKKFTLLRSENPEDYKRTEGIWISDSGNGRIVYMKNLEGEDFYTLGFSGSGPGRFLNPEQIWVDIKGSVYVADRGNNRIIKMDDIRGLGWQEMDNAFNSPRGVAFHGKRLYVSDTGSDRILVYENFGDTIPMAEFKDPKISKPGYLWLDMEGNLYVCCGDTSPQGSIVRIPHDLTIPPSKWHSYKGKGLTGISFTPSQFIQNDEGCFFVDSANQRLVKTDNFKGRNSWEIGAYGRGKFQFLEPKGLSQDQKGSIYIADTGNDRIVCIDPQPGGDWKTYFTAEPTFGLRGPKCVYVWSPRPNPADEEDEDDDKNSKSKSKKK